MEASTSSTVQPQNMYDYMNTLIMNPMIFVIIVVVFLIYLLFFSNLGKSNVGSAPTSPTTGAASTVGSTSNILTIIIVGILAVLVLVNAVQYFFGVDVVANLSNIFTPDAKLDVKVIQNDSNPSGPSVVPEIKIRKQVFNIPGNYYGYEDAKSLCSAYGARLANYTEVEDSYKSGGEWCNYGWSDSQMALYPTQQSTYDGLQKIPGHENDCGRPGINGGYIANPHVKFGVNCYGYKPKMTKEEEELMQNSTPYPKTEKDLAMEKRVEYWKKRLNEILVSPFNYKNWSRI
jgi:uncharacterized membrane protein